jgi:oxygen-independent coproporphyrinogen-3 oxidase
VNERDNNLWQKEFDIAFRLPIKHFSAYALTVEENSLLYRRIHQHKTVEPDEDLASVQYNALSKALTNSPFEQYEVSNFAINGWESKHNSAYWHRVPYVGLGASAHSYDGTHRSWNAANLKDYFAQIEESNTYHERETLTAIDQYNEFVLLGLRTRTGINLYEMEQFFGSERTASFQQYFESDVENDLYLIENNRIRLTAKGLWFADGIAEDAFLTNE